jgi:hypothetical protein
MRLYEPLRRGTKITSLLSCGCSTTSVFAGVLQMEAVSPTALELHVIGVEFVVGHDDRDGYGLAGNRARCNVSRDHNRHGHERGVTCRRRHSFASMGREREADDHRRYYCALTQTATSGLSAALGAMPQETEVSLKTVGARRAGPQ